jgi:hypothetical protein
MLYSNKAFIGGFAAAYYWSSSEKSTTNAWSHYFYVGGSYNYAKSGPYYVRAVRAF